MILNDNNNNSTNDNNENSKNNNEDSGKSLKKSLFRFTDVASIGLVFVASIFIGLAMGYYLDLQFGTKPYLFFLFMLLGIIAGTKNAYKLIKETGIMDAKKE